MTEAPKCVQCGEAEAAKAVHNIEVAGEYYHAFQPPAPVPTSDCTCDTPLDSPFHDDDCPLSLLHPVPTSLAKKERRQWHVWGSADPDATSAPALPTNEIVDHGNGIASLKIGPTPQAEPEVDVRLQVPKGDLVALGSVACSVRGDTPQVITWHGRTFVRIRREHDGHVYQETVPGSLLEGDDPS